MSTDFACIPITSDGQVGGGWGKAPIVAVAQVVDGVIVDWQTDEVGWDVLHDAGEGNHHARIVRFVRDNNITVVVAEHMGELMANMLAKLGLRVELGAAGDARDAIVAATS